MDSGKGFSNSDLGKMAESGNRAKMECHLVQQPYENLLLEMNPLHRRDWTGNVRYWQRLQNSPRSNHPGVARGVVPL
jgi:hypothetical protein